MAPINLYSDTQTRPTDGMRAAIASAVVGDEQRGLDPTTLALQERVAELLGHEAGLFLPSGTMCNEIALRLHARPGRRRGDPRPHRASGQLRGRRAGAAGRPDGAGARRRRRRVHGRAARGGASGRPGTATCRARGWSASSRRATWVAGRVWPLAVVRGVLEVAARFGLRTHLDGARLMNAVVASGCLRLPSLPAGSIRPGSISPRAWVRRWARCWSARASSSTRRGGGSRCSVARSGSRASWPRGVCTRSITTSSGWPIDHENAQVLARGLASLPGVELDPATVETNIVIFSVEDAPGLVRRRGRPGRAAGVRSRIGCGR